MLKTTGIVGPFKTSAQLAGFDAEQPLRVRVTYGADNKDNFTIVLNRHTQAVLERTIEAAKPLISGKSLKAASVILSARVRAAGTEMADDFNQHNFPLENVEIDAGEHGAAESNSTNVAYSQVSEHDAVFWHTHDPKIGPDADYHSHEVKVKFLIAGQNFSEAVRLTGKMHERLQAVTDTFFDKENDFSGVTLEEAGERLFNSVTEAISELREGVTAASQHLHGVSLTIDYDGSLDHPTQQMEFIRSLN